MSQKTMQLIGNHTMATKEGLSPGKEFWESSKTLKTLLEENYFKEEGEEFRWPDIIKAMMSDGECMAWDDFVVVFLYSARSSVPKWCFSLESMGSSEESQLPQISVM